MVVKEVLCKSALSPSGIPTIDYALNPYTGCEHKCLYCYARFMKRFTGHQEEWGEFVDVKINVPQVLVRELAKKPRGVVGLSTVTDPYQPLEKKYKLTRQCLQKLLVYRLPVTIQTKSSLVLRDIDLLKQFPACEVGFTITTVDNEVRKKYELRSSQPKERLAALQRLHKEGLRTYAFMGPILPLITDTDENLRNIIQSVADVNVDCLLVDRLNMRWGVWFSVLNFLRQNYPKLIPHYKRIFWSKNNYYVKLKSKILKLCKEYNVNCEFCY